MRLASTGAVAPLATIKLYPVTNISVTPFPIILGKDAEGNASSFGLCSSEKTGLRDREPLCQGVGFLFARGRSVEEHLVAYFHVSRKGGLVFSPIVWLKIFDKVFQFSLVRHAYTCPRSLA